MAKLPAFKSLWDGFPTGEAAEVKAKIGGRVDAAWITNTCAIRVSRAFNEAGAKVPYVKEQTISGADGKWHFFRVKDLRAFMLAHYGNPTLVAKAPDTSSPVSSAVFANRKGVIHFDVRVWADATGHFTLWDGTSCGDKCYFDKASVVSLWEAA